jgi:hypothetical protein
MSRPFLCLKVCTVVILTFVLNSASSDSENFAERNYCPVSSNMNKNDPQATDYLFSYPSSIYNETESNMSVVECGICDSTGDHLKLGTYNCSTNQSLFCPVQEQNCIDSMYTSQVGLLHNTSTSSFCNLKHNLNNSTKTSNIIFFGGSVTAGCATFGCSKNWKEKSPEYLQHCTSIHCSWTSRFGEWMNRTFTANIQSISLAMNGHGTVISAESVISRLRGAGIDNLSENDMVFLGKILISMLPIIIELIFHCFMNRFFDE